MSDAIEMRLRSYAVFRAPPLCWNVEILGYRYRLYHDGLLVRADDGDPGDEHRECA